MAGVDGSIALIPVPGTTSASQGRIGTPIATLHTTAEQIGSLDGERAAGTVAPPEGRRGVPVGYDKTYQINWLYIDTARHDPDRANRLTDRRDEIWPMVVRTGPNTATRR